jgi:hypothetical protein
MAVINSGVHVFNNHALHLAFLKIETDVNSERLMVQNRFTGELIWHQRTDGGETVRRLLPASFIDQSNLLCVLFDDDLTYQPAVFDGVTPQTVDVNNFDMANA